MKLLDGKKQRPYLSRGMPSVRPKFNYNTIHYSRFQRVKHTRQLAQTYLERELMIRLESRDIDIID